MAGITYGSWTANARQAWAGDYLGREHLMPGGSILLASAFNKADAVVVVVGAAGAIATATSVPVAALSGAIPSGTILDFAGTGKFAKLTAAAAAAATTLTVEALPEALVSTDTATYPGVATNKFISSGTLVGRTTAERAAGTAFGPWTTGDDEVYLIAYDVYDAAVDPQIELYRHNSVVKENFLPGFAALSAGALAAIRAAYATTRGAP